MRTLTSLRSRLCRSSSTCSAAEARHGYGMHGHNGHHYGLGHHRGHHYGWNRGHHYAWRHPHRHYPY